MSVWSNHEWPDDGPDPDDPTDQLAYPEVDAAEWAAFSPGGPPDEPLVDLAAFPPPQPEVEIELMDANWSRQWRWDMPF